MNAADIAHALGDARREGRTWRCFALSAPSSLRQHGLRCVSARQDNEGNTMRDRTLSETFALELMREGKPLMKMHTVNGMRWFIVPGGQVTDTVAARILARPGVQPRDSGLFPGCEQTFQLRGDWRGRHS